ncbi:MAG: stage IV sporulation protein A [Firmicutes bacterium]|nr:stage IV sporulation protein A [Bacillota bacterium]
MQTFDIFEDIAKRTDGEIYLGVVGPVRTGKSTFIKRFMDLLVLPRITDPYDRERSRDELPQSGAGRQIQTTEPKFVPSEAVTIALDEATAASVRLVDCVGYTVEGAIGYLLDEGPRMVVTPWFDEPIPFQRAAEIGTQKVIEDHSTIGIVVTTDGSITEIPRRAYVDAERRVIDELKAIGKPFVVVLNSTRPEGSVCRELAEQLSETYGTPVVPLDCMNMSEEETIGLFKSVLYEFPVREVNIRIPRWIAELSEDHQLKQSYRAAIEDVVDRIHIVRDVSSAAAAFGEHDYIRSYRVDEVNLGDGAATISLTAPEELYYRVLSDISGLPIEGEHHVISLVQQLSLAKREYDKVAAALTDVRQSGYGIVTPILEEISFFEPDLIRHGNRFGVRLKAKAPSIHMIRVDVETEVSPVVGTEKQGEELVRKLTDEFESDPTAVWEKDFLGTPLHQLIKEGLASKLVRMPEDAQRKLQEALQRIVNEGSGGLICIIL